MRARTPSFRLAFGLACALALVGCKKLEQDAERRKEKASAEVEAEFARLAFLVAELDRTGREQKSCGDDALPRHLERSPRQCKRLALTDEANVRRLFGQGGSEGGADWSWMRTLAFDRLEPLGAKDARPSTTKSELEGLARTQVGIFTANEVTGAEAEKRYRGWLVIVDTVDEKVRCQVAIDADVTKVFAPPKRGNASGNQRTYVEAFFREVDRQLAPITKNFCTE